MPHISHLYQDASSTWQIQTNEDHCSGVADLAASFAAPFGMSAWARLIGLLHDRGKERDGFQAHIRRDSGYDPDCPYAGLHHHSLTGAQLIHSLKRMDALYWLSNPIAGHHRGLYNTDELRKELSTEIPPEVSKEMPDVELTFPDFKNLAPTDSAHIARMLFSCLVDADWLDTERFMNRDRFELRGGHATLTALKERLDKYIAELTAGATGDLNRLRAQIQRECIAKSGEAPGFHQLTVPTGGGKTLASVIWAINHAIKHGKRRIIIAIPFTSIIVQTADTLKRIFGEDNVIEHHSCVNDDRIDEKDRLASENWDAPIIVTTNVQLFESMFSNKPSKCRKLHNVCDSVVILDEVQTLPLSFLQPIVDAMQTYARLFGTSFLFCTATQPVLTGERRGNSGAVFHGISEHSIGSLIDSSWNLHQRLKRVDVEILPERFDYAGIAAKLRAYDRVLCVVNSRKHAASLYQELKGEAIPTIHLSRYMCAAHIMEKIEEIKRILKSDNPRVRVVSTQLIEAGVDLDFPVVYRQLAGLDSILQAAGRCNREGKLPVGRTYVFSFEKDSRMESLRSAEDTMKDMIAVTPDADWFAPETIERYYTKLYHRVSSFDKEEINSLLHGPEKCDFEEASQKFRLINDDGINIIVNFGDSERLVEVLRNAGPSRSLVRKLSRYSVNIPTRLFLELEKGGLIEQPHKGFFYIPLSSQYDKDAGLKTDNDYLEQCWVV